jgi:hypothetical protein
MGADDVIRTARQETWRTDNNEIRTASVWGDMFDALDDIINRGDWGIEDGRSSERTEHPEGDFFGSADMAEAVQLIRGGWSEHRAEAEKLIGQVMADPVIAEAQSKRFVQVPDYIGDECDVDRFIAGDPECMLRFDTEESVRPDAVVRIVVNSGAMGDVKGARILARGFVIAATIEVLQTLGRSTEVWLTSTVRAGAGGTFNGRRMHTTAVKVKDATESMDLDDLLFVAAHPSVHRRFTFALRECESEALRQGFGFHDRGGYGRTDNHYPDEEDRLFGGEAHIRFETTSGTWATDPVEHVKRLVGGFVNLDRSGVAA